MNPESNPQTPVTPPTEPTEPIQTTPTPSDQPVSTEQPTPTVTQPEVPAVSLDDISQSSDEKAVVSPTFLQSMKATEDGSNKSRNTILRVIVICVILFGGTIVALLSTLFNQQTLSCSKSTTISQDMSDLGIVSEEITNEINYKGGNAHSLTYILELTFDDESSAKDFSGDGDVTESAKLQLSSLGLGDVKISQTDNKVVMSGSSKNNDTVGLSLGTSQSKYTIEQAKQMTELSGYTCSIK